MGDSSAPGGSSARGRTHLAPPSKPSSMSSGNGSKNASVTSARPLPSPTGRGSSWRPEIGYRAVPPAQDDPVARLQTGDVPGQVSLRFLHIQNYRGHGHYLKQILSLFGQGYLGLPVTRHLVVIGTFSTVFRVTE